MTIYFGEADLPTMFADWPNEISAANGASMVTGRCLFNESDELRMEGHDAPGDVMNLCRAEVATNDFPFLVGNSECSIDGRAFRVWKRLQQGDGATTLLLLREV